MNTEANNNNTIETTQGNAPKGTKGYLKFYGVVYIVFIIILIGLGNVYLDNTNLSIFISIIVVLILTVTVGSYIIEINRILKKIKLK